MGVWTFVIALLLDLALLFHSVFVVVLLSDLSCDYINPIDLVNKVNPYTLPAMVTHGLVTVLMLVTGNFYSFALNLPLALWNANKIIKKDYTLDATEIFRTLSKHQTEVYIKLAYFMLFFFWYLFQMISGIVSNEETHVY